MIVLDASVWISSLQPTEPNHAVSRRWRARQRAEGVPITVPAHFLAEVTAAVTRASESEADGLAVMQSILTDSLVVRAPLSNTLAEAASRAAARCRIRAGDALYVALAEELDVPLITWDNELLHRATILVDVRLPTA